MEKELTKLFAAIIPGIKVENGFDMDRKTVDECVETTVKFHQEKTKELTDFLKEISSALTDKSDLTFWEVAVKHRADQLLNQYNEQG